MRPYELPTLTVEGRRSRCGARPGESGALGALLDAADVALQVARATSNEQRLAFSTATYLKVLDPDPRVLDSVSTGVTRLARWPIESADPDSLRAWASFANRRRPNAPRPLTWSSDPRSWRPRAPQAVRSAGSSRLRLKRWLETGGRVTAVRTADGALDSPSTTELLSESR